MLLCDWLQHNIISILIKHDIQLNVCVCVWWERYSISRYKRTRGIRRHKTRIVLHFHV